MTVQKDFENKISWALHIVVIMNGLQPLHTCSIHVGSTIHKWQSGETGSRATLKMQSTKVGVGSSPTSATSGQLVVRKDVWVQVPPWAQTNNRLRTRTGIGATLRMWWCNPLWVRVPPRAHCFKTDGGSVFLKPCVVPSVPETNHGCCIEQHTKTTSQLSWQSTTLLMLGSWVRIPAGSQTVN